MSLNILPQYQTPKPRGDREDPRPKNVLRNDPSSDYRWNSSLLQHEDFGDCGAHDERVAWRCCCGAEIDCRQDRCRRCGSTEPGELR